MQGVGIIETSNGLEASGEQLLNRYRQGDDEAFEKIVALYEDELAGFIHSIVHDYHETKHIVIDAFAELAVGCARFKGASTLKSYLFGIGKRLAFRHLKDKRNSDCVSFDKVAELLAGDESSLHDFLEREENKWQLREAMQDLKKEYKEVLIHLYFEDMSYQEAGQVMKKSVRQIKDLAYNAKASLKKKLESKEFTGY